MSGGSGGQTNSVSEFKPPANTQPGWDAYIQRATSLSNTPYSQSGIPTVAPLNAQQNAALQFTADRALNGAPDLNAGRAAAMNAANGAFDNPWAQSFGGIARGEAYNPWSEGVHGMAQGQANPYTSDLYTQKMIGNTADQMAKAYSVGGAAQNDAAANMAGSFGGGGWQAMKNLGEAGLAKQIGDMSTQVQQQQQQYGGSQYQADQARMLQALGLGSQNYNTDVSNQMNAANSGANIYNQSVGNRLSGGALAGNLSADDWKSAEALFNTGNVYNSYQQKLLDSLNNQWGTQNTYDTTMNEYLRSALQAASGGQGSTTVSGPGQSPWAGLLGGGMAAYSLFGK